MTLTFDPIYVYVTVNLVLAGMLIFNIRKTDKLREEINSLWQQIAIMAVASAGVFDKIQKKIDEKEDKK